MSKVKKSFADITLQAQVMASALKNHQSEMLKRVIDEEYVQKMEKLREQSIELNSEQERLKALLKEKTEALNVVIKTLSSQIAESKKIVKITVPQVRWREFGIEDKR